MVSYAEEREANMIRNRGLLVTLGYEKLKPDSEPKERRHTHRKKRKPFQGTNKREANEDLESHADDMPSAKAARIANDENAVPGHDEPTGGRRRSSRIAGKPANAMARVEQSRGTPLPMPVKGLVDTAGLAKRGRQYDPKTYGSIPGIEVGSWWASREECSRDAIHAPWVGGIAPGPDGAYSIALSGGYDDDVDDGYAFTYTGAGKLKFLPQVFPCENGFFIIGGRDLKGTKAAPRNLRTAAQSFDQSFEHNHNKALKRSMEAGKPVRVIRGYKLPSKYGPSEGYRYDGLYAVRKYWQERGLNKGGFLVCKFAFVRLPGQPPIAVKDIGGEADEVEAMGSDGELDADGDED